MRPCWKPTNQLTPYLTSMRKDVPSVWLFAAPWQNKPSQILGISPTSPCVHRKHITYMWHSDIQSPKTVSGSQIPPEENSIWSPYFLITQLNLSSSAHTSADMLRHPNNIPNTSLSDLEPNNNSWVSWTPLFNYHPADREYEEACMIIKHVDSHPHDDLV